MPNNHFSLKYWVFGERPENELGIEVSRVFLDDRVGSLDTKYQGQTWGLDGQFLKFPLDGNRWVRIANRGLEENKRPKYLVELIGSVDAIRELARTNDLPFSRREVGIYQ
jgi:hypothetical protein